MRYAVSMSNSEMGAVAAPNGNQIVAANIRAELAYAGLNQVDLASAVDLSEMALSRRLSENYAAEFTASEIFQIADALGIEASELFRSRERKAIKVRAASARRLVAVDDSTDEVGPTGIEPMTSTVLTHRFAAKPERIAPVLRFPVERVKLAVGA